MVSSRLVSSLALWWSIAFAACSSQNEVESRVATSHEALQVLIDPAFDCDDNLPADTLQQYAQKCDAVIGETVPGFNCDNGDLVPTDHHVGSSCDRPNVLNGVCDPGSRFQVLKNTATAVIVAHCRKQGLGADYGDVAVIQYNKVNGGTCFYQALRNRAPAGSSLPAAFGPPSAGGSAQSPWMSPTATAQLECHTCHDNGPFVRSPYLAQMADNPIAVMHGNVLPGSHDNGYNHSNPYAFVGNDFQRWKVYEVSDTGAGANCSKNLGGCHRMGISSTGTAFHLSAPGSPLGTSQYFAQIATGPNGTQPSKNNHSLQSPIWMIPGQNTYTAATETAANEIRACAQDIVRNANNPGLPPAGPNCGVKPFGQGVTCKGPCRQIINGETQAPVDTQDQDVTLPICDPTSLGSGFCYWKSIHGPFWQTTPGAVPSEDPMYLGSGLQIVTPSNVWSVRAVKKSGGQPVAPPGGEMECLNFADVDAAYVPNPNDCGSTSHFLTDPLGTQWSLSTPMGPLAVSVNPLTGFLGNVAQGRFDWLRVRDSLGVELVQAHYPPNAPYNGVYYGGAFTNGCQGWTPVYAAKDVFTWNDVTLVGYPTSKSVRCFISGVTGAWESTRSGGAAQPFAQIYADLTGAYHLRVWPNDVGDPQTRWVPGLPA